MPRQPRELSDAEKQAIEHEQRVRAEMERKDWEAKRAEQDAQLKLEREAEAERREAAERRRLDMLFDRVDSMMKDPRCQKYPEQERPTIALMALLVETIDNLQEIDGSINRIPEPDFDTSELSGAAGQNEIIGLLQEIDRTLDDIHTVVTTSEKG